MTIVDAKTEQSVRIAPEIRLGPQRLPASDCATSDKNDPCFRLLKVVKRVVAMFSSREENLSSFRALALLVDKSFYRACGTLDNNDVEFVCRHRRYGYASRYRPHYSLYRQESPEAYTKDASFVSVWVRLSYSLLLTRVEKCRSLMHTA